MPDIDFTIRTRAELAGAEATATSLEMQIGKMKALGQDSSELAIQLDRVNESLKNAKVPAEALELPHRELHKLFGQLGRESIPLLGHALGDMLYGPIGPALLLLSIVGELKGKFGEWNQSLQDAADSDATANFTKGIDAIKDVMDAAAKSIGDYEARIASIAASESTVAVALQSQLTLMKALAAEREKERKAAEDVAKARLAHQVQTGEITPEQGAITEATAAVAAARAAAKDKRDAEDAELARQENARDNASIEFDRADKDYKEKEKQRAATEAHRKRITADFGPDTTQDVNTWDTGGWGATAPDTKTNPIQGMAKAISTAQAQVDAWVDQVEKAKGVIADKSSPGGGDTVDNQRHLKDAEDILAQAQKQLDNLERARRQYDSAFAPGANDAYNQQVNATEAAKKKADEDKTTEDNLTKQTQDTRDKQAATRPGEDKELADRIALIMQQAVDKLQFMQHGGEVARGVQVADLVEKEVRAAKLAQQYQSTGKITPEDAAFLLKFVNEHGGNARTAGEAAGYATSNWGNVPQNENNPVNEQTWAALTASEKFLFALAQALGAHATNIKQAADYISQFKDDSNKLMDAIAKLVKEGYTQQQKQIDQLYSMVNGAH